MNNYNKLIFLTKGVAIFLHHSFPMEVQQVYRDAEICYIIIKGYLLGKELIIANVYVPNDCQSTLFSSFFDTLHWYHSSHIILGGDFNSVLQPCLDRIKQTPKTFSKSTCTHLNTMQPIGSWRALNVSAREYTFYSYPYESYSHLDYIFCTPIILSNSLDATIHPNPWSDHQINAISTQFIGLSPTSYSWRLNESLSTDPTCQQELATAIGEYFQLNSTPDTSSATLWLAHKAVLRGHLIQIAADRNKEKWKQILASKEDLQGIYKIHTNTHDPLIDNLISQKRSELDALLKHKTEKALRWSKANIFLSSNSYSSMFTRILNQSIRPPHIYNLRTPQIN